MVPPRRSKHVCVCVCVFCVCVCVCVCVFGGLIFVESLRKFLILDVI